MTIGRQLIIAVSVICFVALLGVQTIHVRSAQRHLQDQLESLAQDTATSLGLTLGAMLRKNDIALAETVINPVVDRGHYALVEFASLDRATLVTKTLPVNDAGNYPHWFAALFPLTAPSAESLVSSGWRQLGKVTVKGHPRYAYEQLWTTARNTAIYLLMIYAAGLLALRLFLHGVLGPLAAIERAAQAISARSFIAIDIRPATRELARVVDAMNILSRKVREAIATETTRADTLQRVAYIDEVSGLLNRRGLAAHFDNTYGDERGAFNGVFALIELPDLGPINREIGPHRCDELLQAVARATESVTTSRNGQTARRGGALFALLVPEINVDTARDALVELQSRIGMIIAEHGAGGRLPVCVGVAAAPDARANLDTLANAAETMLVRAREQDDGNIAWHVLSAEVSGRKGADALSAVRDALAAHRVQLVGQPVLSLPERTLLHTEIMARLSDASGAVMTATDFIAIVAQHGLIRRLDEVVIESACRAVREANNDQAIAINLSVRSLEDSGFVEWLTSTLQTFKPIASRLVFEISEHGVVQNEAAVARLAAALARYGASFAIDHFGVHRNSLALIQHLKPAYLKLSHVHTKHLLSDSGTRFYVDAVVRASRQLDIPVIAQNVEDESVIDLLQELGVAGYQGYAVGKPMPWPA
jgi:diguanylate cyclase (GGDEF)-like protein